MGFFFFFRSCHANDGIVPQLGCNCFFSNCVLLSFTIPPTISDIHYMEKKCEANFMHDTSSLSCLLWNPKI
jgi:hypothetical protein